MRSVGFKSAASVSFGHPGAYFQQIGKFRRIGKSPLRRRMQFHQIQLVTILLGKAAVFVLTETTVEVIGLRVVEGGRIGIGLVACVF